MPDRISAGPVDLVRWSPELGPRLHDAIVISFTELHQWMEWAGTPGTVEDRIATLSDGVDAFEDDQHWAYVLMERGEAVVGSAGLYRRGPGDAREVGYWVRSDRTGRGYATAAARVLTDATFTVMADTAEVRIRMDRLNVASAAVPRKLGFRLIGEVPAEPMAPGHSGVDLIWSLSRASWSTRSGA